MNTATDAATGGTWRNLLGIDNPLALERTPYDTPKSAAYGYITEGAFTAWTAAAGGGAASAGARSSTLSVVPAETTPGLSRGAQMITDLVGRPGQASGTLNKAGDLVITGRQFKFRVDFKNPGNDVPHMHLQELVNGDWVDAVQGVHRIRPR